jgi:hypothetical protein
MRRTKKVIQKRWVFKEGLRGKRGPCAMSTLMLMMLVTFRMRSMKLSP